MFRPPHAISLPHNEPGYPYRCFSVVTQPITIVPFPMHIIRLFWEQVRHLHATDSLLSNFSRLPHSAPWSTFLLAAIGKVITMTAEEILPGPIKNRYSFPASRTKEPYSVTAIIAGCPVKGDQLFNRLPFSAIRPVSVVQDHPVCFHPVIDKAGLFTAI